MGPCRNILASSIARAAALAVFIVVLIGSGSAGAAVNGFYVRSLPKGYPSQERLFSGLRDSGADHVILELPMSTDGRPETNLLTGAVYLAHQAGLRILVVLPTRQLPHVVAEQEAWEDLQYDLASGSLRRSGMLDLFRSEALAHLMTLARTVAAYSVDGILLGNDFRYEAADGFGASALQKAGQKLGGDIRPREMFPKIAKGAGGPVVEQYGPRFGSWAALKRDRLAEVFTALRGAARSVKPQITFGVAVPLILPVAVPSELLVKYSFDIATYRGLGADHYWALLDYQDVKERQGLTVRECMEVLSRQARSAVTTAKDDDRLVLVIPATTTAGRTLSLSEVEEATRLARQCGRTGIAFMIGPVAAPPAQFVKKLLKPGSSDAGPCYACDAKNGTNGAEERAGARPL